MSRSYDFDRMPDPRKRAELARLQAQACAFLDRELAHLEAFGLRPGARFLEVGCGPGFITGAVADRVGSRGRAVGLDRSADLLRVAREVVAPQHGNLEFVEADAAATGLESAAFDLAYLRFVCQHLPDPVAVLREVRRVLVPGGAVVILDVDDDWLSVDPPSPAFRRFHQRAAEEKAARGGDRHVGPRLVRYLQQAGFRDPRLQVFTVTSQDLGFGNFLDLTTRFKADLLPPDEAALLLEALGSETDPWSPPEPFGIVAMFGASGRA